MILKINGKNTESAKLDNKGKPGENISPTLHTHADKKGPTLLHQFKEQVRMSFHESNLREYLI